MTHQPVKLVYLKIIFWEQLNHIVFKICEKVLFLNKYFAFCLIISHFKLVACLNTYSLRSYFLLRMSQPWSYYASGYYQYPYYSVCLFIALISSRLMVIIHKVTLILNNLLKKLLIAPRFLTRLVSKVTRLHHLQQ